MKYPIHATPALPARVESAKQIAVFYAVLLTIMAVAQLFTFEEFVVIMGSMNFPLPDILQGAVAPTIVALEIFAIPFLLRMALSPGFRWVSMLCGWAVALGWLKTSMWMVTMMPDAQNVGFVGGVFHLVPGWWAVTMSFLLVVMAAWAAYGLWPGVLRSTRVEKRAK